MKLGSYTLGSVIATGIASVVFILFLKFVGGRWNLPIVTPVARAI